MKTLRFILTGAFIMLFGSVMAQSITDKYNAAAALIQQQKFAEAIAPLEDIMKNAGSATDDEMALVDQAKKLLPDFYFRIGAAAAQQNNFEVALTNMTKAYDLAELYGNEPMQLRITPMIGRVYQAMGADAFNKKDYAKAIEVFSQAYAKFPTETEIALLLAKSYAESGDMAKAKEVYEGVISLENRHTRYGPPAAKAKQELTQYLLIEASEAGGEKNLPRVIEVTDAILAYDPSNATAHLLRIQTATNVKDYDAVIKYADAAIAAQTEAEKKAEINFFAGSAFENRGNKPRAVEYYRRVTIGPNAAAAKKQAEALNQ